MPDMKPLIEIATAIGTVAVAIMAIWGEKVRAWLSPPKLKIEIHTPRGSPTRHTLAGAIDPSGGVRTMYYYLRVVNLRPWLTAQNCRVLLKAVSRRRPDGSFLQVHMPVPAQLIWSNEGDTPQRVVVTRTAVLDFGYLSEGAQSFLPLLYVYANNANFAVAKGEAVRYQVEIDASNLPLRHAQTFEVSWDGEWDFEPEKMQHHLVVREVAEP